MYLLSRFGPATLGSVVVFGLFIVTASDLAAPNLTGLTLAVTLARLVKGLLVCLSPSCLARSVSSQGGV